MNLLVIGSGGREHALAWKLAQSPRVRQVFTAPGNAGTVEVGTNLAIGIHEHDRLCAAVREHGIGLVVIGPDDALAAGLVDRLEAERVRVFGPRRAAAQVEWSKAFAKDFMRRHGIPTAAAREFDALAPALAHCRAATAFPLVVKADGLAAGKGVIIAGDLAAAEAAVRSMLEDAQFGAAGQRVVIEECLQGREASVHALLDGQTALLLPLAQDHKRLLDGNTGPNTGGMGTVSPPVGQLDPDFTRLVEEQVLQPFLRGAAADELGFRGLLFPGLMLTADGPRVLEFNARFGDPETQVLLPRLKSDLLDLLEACVDGKLAEARPVWDDRAAVCVILASEGYPEKPLTGRPIEIAPALAGERDVFLFHGGTRREATGRLVTSGGRVLGVTALGATVEEARTRAYAAADLIRFAGLQRRSDVGV